MIRFSKIFFYITVAVLLVWQLPWCYAFLTLKPVKTPFTMYSSVLGDFVITQLDENKQLHRYDTKGNTYTQQQVDSLLPSLYVRQLTADFQIHPFGHGLHQKIESCLGSIDG